MARPKTARLQTAYDLGHEHGVTGSRPHAADDIIGSDHEMQQAYDDGLQAGTDSLDAPRTDAEGAGPSRPHRPRPTSTARPRKKAAAPAKTSASSSSSAGAKGQRFSHPLHWGSGARGQVVRRRTPRPTLTPPRGFAVRDWTGFGFGCVLYALGAAYITLGPGAPTAWLKAKFLNDTTAGEALVGNAKTATTPGKTITTKTSTVHSAATAPSGVVGPGA